MKNRFGIFVLIALGAPLNFSFAQEVCSDDSAYKYGLLGRKVPADCRSENHESYRAAYERGVADRLDSDFFMEYIAATGVETVIMTDHADAAHSHDYETHKHEDSEKADDEGVEKSE